MTHLIQRLREDIFSLILLALLLAITAEAIAVAEWVDGLYVLSFIVLLAVISGYFLAISRFSEFVMLIFTVIYGLFAVWTLVGMQIEEIVLSVPPPSEEIVVTGAPDSIEVETSLAENVAAVSEEDMEPTFKERSIELGYRTYVWGEALISRGFNRDNLMFVLALGFAFWFLGFNAAANLFRTGHLWLAVIPPGLVLLINNFYYFGEQRLELLLVAYMFLTFTLAVLTNSIHRERIWRSRRMTFTPGIRLDLMRGGVLAGLVLIIVAWSAPAASASNRLSATWEQSSNPWHNIQENFDRLFSGVEGGVAASADYYGGVYLTMGGPINLGHQIVMYVFAPEGHHYYWRSKVFDSYENGRWRATSEKVLYSDTGVIKNEDDVIYGLRRNVQQQFQIVIPSTELVYAAPQAISFSALPEGITYEAFYTQAEGKDYASMTSARSVDLLRSGDRYTATSSVSIADAQSLRGAGTDYPSWVQERYLAYPDNITQRTINLAERITAPYDNPYDKATAVESWLRSNITYNEAVALPPADEERIDYFLFESLEGYCNYYASAMAIMLRTQGIPSRIATGFVQGERDPETGAYQVLESDAHAWVEVYFPRYGWIEFEPTASETLIERPEIPLTQEEEEFIAGLRDAPIPDQALLGEGSPELDPALLDDNESRSFNLVEIIRNFTVPPWLKWMLGLMGSVVVLGIGTWLWFEERGLGGLSQVSKAYARLNIFAPFMGVRLDSSSTPYERSKQFEEHNPQSRAAVNEIVRLYVDEQYAPAGKQEIASVRAETQAKNAWGQLRPLFIRQLAVNQLRRLNPIKLWQKRRK